MNAFFSKVSRVGYSVYLPYLLAVFLIGLLIYVTGVWDFAAYTRILDLAVRLGIVAYTDNDEGLIEGIPDKDNYVLAQTSIDWPVITLVVGLFATFHILRSLELKEVATYLKAKVPTAANSIGAYLQSQKFQYFTPMNIGDQASEIIYADKLNTSKKQAQNISFVLRLFILFEIAIFSLIGLSIVGVGVWSWQMFVFVLMATLAYLVIGPVGKKGNYRNYAKSYVTAAWNHIALLTRNPKSLIKISALALIAFALEDLAAYFTAMALDINVELKAIVMGVIGSYIARLFKVTPGGIGQFEWGFAAGLYIGGVGLPEAGTIAIVDNMLRMTVFGAMYWINKLFASTDKGMIALSKLKSALSVSSDSNLQSNISWKLPGDDSADKLDVPTYQQPNSQQYWSRMVNVGLLAVGLYGLHIIAGLLADYWLFESLGYKEVFQTNFDMQLMLFIAGALLFFLAVTLPIRLNKVTKSTRNLYVRIGTMLALPAGWILASDYAGFLTFSGQFGETDPIFGHDIGFYVFTLPTIKTMLYFAIALILTALISGVITTLNHSPKINESSLRKRIKTFFATVSTPYNLALLTLMDVAISAVIFLTRYSLLIKDNSSSSVYNGADFIDVSGILSTLNAINIATLVSLLDIIGVVILLSALRINQNWNYNKFFTGRRVLLATVGLTLFSLGFASLVAIRDATTVVSNEPVIQLPYIDQHIQSTRKAYDLNDIEEIEYKPNRDNDALPSLAEVNASPTIKNTPLWPTNTEYLEEVLDPQHSQRPTQLAGETKVYGPTLETLRQEQKFRSYYDFLSVHMNRYEVDEELQIYATAAREVPLIEPQPWLAWWGQRFVLFTHGHGLVQLPVDEATENGSPNYAVKDVPARTGIDELETENNRIYYGQGAGSMALTNVSGLKELDYPTDQGREQYNLPEDVNAGIKLDSLLKRIVFGYKSSHLVEFTFSDIINNKTRVHVVRQPQERLEKLAPFLFIDSNVYPTTDSENIMWVANGMTTTDHYPYSRMEELGDKSFDRVDTNRFDKNKRKVNYVEDSVKATVNAFTGEVTLYKFDDSPIINVWADVYPSLFADSEAIPGPIEDQLTYPMALYHTQFDDLFIFYHMTDPLYFFNQEDSWDDADEVLGSVIESGESITFSIEPYNLVVEAEGDLLEANTKQQLALSMPFSPEGAQNLRAIAFTYQQGKDYGKQFVLTVPKSHFIPGPEQVDAVIDQDPEISQQITLLNRDGNEVIRGHTTLLPIGKEVVYVEPLYIRSAQNPITQLKKVIVIVRGEPYMGDTLKQALSKAFN